MSINLLSVNTQKRCDLCKLQAVVEYYPAYSTIDNQEYFCPEHYELWRLSDEPTFAELAAKEKP